MTHQDAIDMASHSDHPENGSQIASKTRPHATKPESSMNGPLYLQSSGKILVRRSKRKGRSPWKQVTTWFVENQIGFSFNLIALLFLAHVSIPKAREHTVKFFTLSNFNPRSAHYAVGFDDVYLISFGIVVFTGLRAACMEYVLAPFAKWRGLSKRKDVTRFSEQAWLLMYDSVFWTLGLYIYYNSPYWLNTRELWTNWPSREISGLMKGYMLAQLSFWLQQVIVINIEARRKDHWQMLTHHFVTIALIYASYSYHHTRVGNLILVLMDVVDILLPLAKCLKYMGHTVLCDYAFGAFMVTWFFSRHVAYPIVCYSVWKDTQRIIPAGCFRGSADDLIGPFDTPSSFLRYLEPFYSPRGIICYDGAVKWVFLSMLLFLQAMIIVWFGMIVRVAIKVINGSGAEDSRSDDEYESDEQDDEFEYEEAQLLEEDVGVDEIDLQAWERRAGVKRQAVSSAVTLPGHSDRKELLGRIGCEKQVD